MQSQQNETSGAKIGDQSLQLSTIHSLDKLPPWLNRGDVSGFFHEKMKPYNDSPPDVEKALDYAFSPPHGMPGFLVLATQGKSMVGGLLMLKTGMDGYIPPNLLLFVAVDPALRGKGMGRKIIEHALEACQGDVKLHVEVDNPAKRLYERLGFANKYAEMRLIRK